MVETLGPGFGEGLAWAGAAVAHEKEPDYAAGTEMVHRINEQRAAETLPPQIGTDADAQLRFGPARGEYRTEAGELVPLVAEKPGKGLLVAIQTMVQLHGRRSSIVLPAGIEEGNNSG
jgi:hypothetical protein